MFDTLARVSVTGEISVIRLLNSQTGSAATRRNRKRWAVVLKREGKTYYTIGGRKILSDRLHPVVLPKGCSYDWLCTEPGECLMIEFDAPETANDIFSFTVTSPDFFLRAFAKTEKCLRDRTPRGTLESKHLLYGLLLDLCGTEKHEYVPRDTRAILLPALEYIYDRYYDTGITNEFLAGLCGISTVYFRKLFQRACGMPPVRYLHMLRISKAKDLLLSDYASITQVAKSTGYGSVYHFSKMFRVYTGMSPTEYAGSAAQERG